jgi:heat shock protein HtpX
VYRRVSRKLGAGLLDEVVRDGADGRGANASIVVAHLLSLLVVLVYPLLVAASVLLLRALWPHVIGVAVALIPLFFALALLPWPRRHRVGVVVGPDECPELRDLIARCAAESGAPEPEFLVLDAGWNASVSRRGLLRHRTLTLGVPFFGAISGQQRVALVGHELAHEINGDPARRLIPAFAITSLIRWFGFLYPGGIYESGRRDSALLTIPLLALARLVELWLLLILQLLGRESQRAEFRADAIAARLAGTAGVLGLQETGGLRDLFVFQIQRVVTRPADRGDFLMDLRSTVQRVPLGEHQRRRRASELTDSRLDATHPPDAHRLRALEAHPAEPVVVLEPEADAQIDAELSKYSTPVRDHLAARARDRMHRGGW